MVENKTKKAVGHLTKSPGARRDEFPVKSEPDLGFYPQLPLLDVDLFKKFPL